MRVMGTSYQCAPSGPTGSPCAAQSGSSSSDAVRVARHDPGAEVRSLSWSSTVPPGRSAPVDPVGDGLDSVVAPGPVRAPRRSTARSAGPAGGRRPAPRRQHAVRRPVPLRRRPVVVREEVDAAPQLVAQRRPGRFTARQRWSQPCTATSCPAVGHLADQPAVRADVRAEQEERRGDLVPLQQVEERRGRGGVRPVVVGERDVAAPACGRPAAAARSGSGPGRREVSAGSELEPGRAARRHRRPGSCRHPGPVMRQQQGRTEVHDVGTALGLACRSAVAERPARAAASRSGSRTQGASPACVQGRGVGLAVAGRGSGSVSTRDTGGERLPGREPAGVLDHDVHGASARPACRRRQPSADHCRPPARRGASSAALRAAQHDRVGQAGGRDVARGRSTAGRSRRTPPVTSASGSPRRQRRAPPCRVRGHGPAPPGDTPAAGSTTAVRPRASARACARGDRVHGQVLVDTRGAPRAGGPTCR